MKRLIPFLLLCLVIGAPAAFSQSVTTSGLQGRVEGKTVDKVVELPGALVEAVHVPTGTNYQVVTRDDGGYSIPMMRAGGPYSLTFSCEGFKKEEVKDVYLKLGEARTFNVQLVMESIDAGEVLVVASNPIINPNRTGASQNVTLDTIDVMPSITRSLDDLTRLSPQFDSNKERPGSFNANGRSARYNNIQIDGTQNNDLFGLSDLGSPGGQTEATPISMDAIQEFQIVLAPYDVRQGGFTGGGVNVVTRGGSNEFHGSIYFYGRNQSLVGKGTNEIEYPEFKDYQVGFRIGGPIIKDRLFFFVNGELDRHTDPSEYIIDDSGSPYDWGGANVSVADAQRFVQICQKYGYNPGGFSSFYTRRKEANKLFVRIDANISDNHHLTVRHNYNAPLKDNLYLYPDSFKFPDINYVIKDKTNSTVVQLNSTLSNSLFNEATVSYTRIRDRRSGATRFPQIQVYVNSSSSYSFSAGTEYSSQANELDQDVYEITDNLTWIWGKHSFVFGTHNEVYKFRNLFIQNLFGSYRFTSLDDFNIGKANRYQVGFANGSDPLLSARFRVAQIGFYFGDTFSVKPNVKLTYGLRVDVPYMLDTPTANPDTVTYFGIPTNQTASGNLLWSPRVGFNWDINSDGKNNLRGGIGLFSGRVPYVWLSNQFSNTGIEFTRITVSGASTPAFNPDPDNQPHSFAAQTNEVNLIDPDFKYPSIIRGDIAFDRQLPWGLVGTVEFVYTKVLKDILYKNINLLATGKTLYDGRPLYGTAGATSTSWTTNWLTKKYTNCMYLTNTDEGKSWNLSFQLQKQFSGGFSANASYTLGKSYDVNSGTSSVAYSNWRYNNIRSNPNEPELTFSAFDVRHSIKVALSYQREFLKNAATTVSMFLTSRSGRPFSYVYASDMNGDGANNDLIYVPRDQNDIILTTNNWDALNAFINGDPALSQHRGEIVMRNSAREPWNHSVDVRFMQDIPLPWLKGHKIEFSMDIMNFLNMLNKDWGVYRYVNFDNSLLTFRGLDAATNRPKLAYSPGQRYVINDLLSRWQIQFGIRYSF